MKELDQKTKDQLNNLILTRKLLFLIATNCPRDKLKLLADEIVKNLFPINQHSDIYKLHPTAANLTEEEYNYYSHKDTEVEEMLYKRLKEEV